jgi:hypothetical protein
MPRVKVGLDQWVVVNNGTELLTDGLSGCIAVMAWTDEQYFLAHVYSGYEDHAAQYNHQLDLPIAVMRNRGGTIRGGAIAYSDNSDLTRANLLKAWLQTKLPPRKNVEMYKASGVRMSHSMYGVEVMEKEGDNRDFYTRGYSTTSSGTAHLTNWGRLSDRSSEAS